MKIQWRAGSRLWIHGKALDGQEVPTGIALAGGNNEELDSVRVRTDEGLETLVSKRRVWMVRYTHN